MTIRRSTRTRTLLAGLAVAGALTGTGAATAAASSAPGDEPSVGDSLPDQRAPGADWPPELTEHTRLFVNPYRSYLVQERNGVPTLVLSTGWDSCYFMTQHGQQRYPC